MTLLWWHWLLLVVLVLLPLYTLVGLTLYKKAEYGLKSFGPAHEMMALFWPVFWSILILLVWGDGREERARIKLLKKGKL